MKFLFFFTTTDSDIPFFLFFASLGVLNTNLKSKNCEKDAFSRQLNLKLRKLDGIFIFFLFFCSFERPEHESQGRKVQKRSDFQTISVFLSYFENFFQVFFLFFSFLNATLRRREKEEEIEVEI